MNANPEPIKIMAYLLDNGTALHQAVERQDAERVRFLLQRGANRNIKGFQGFTPIEAAEIMGLNEMADILRFK
ncbi:hypothetical protein K432DRAFT_412068 [Lepidopterella palustris CBS 459.81]|uniref:Ankyrin n=1 Tax=Lepidopterella palustris CBS 459.81 TaxID=1314670 RepID=A0A8E2DW41_9PEZI|nr:hypothetical protein K432DRAFT_412068 [Lepidopterella palustris CBS 459.81]